MIREFQVRCLERPCGDLFMQFELLNARGESLETLKLHENDAHQGNDAHHGEERRFDVDSENPQAAAFRLIEFVARFCWSKPCGPPLGHQSACSPLASRTARVGSPPLP